jgi:hypothetical protein
MCGVKENGEDDGELLFEQMYERAQIEDEGSR